MGIQPQSSLERKKTGSQNNILLAALRSYSALLAKHEIWILGPFVAATMVSARLLPVPVGIALIFWLLRWIGTGKLTIRTPADGPIAILLLMLPVTWLVTVIPDKTIPQIFRLLSGVAIYYAIVNWAISFRRLKLLSISIIVVGFALVLMSPISVTWVAENKLSIIPASLYERFTVMVSDTVHPNVMGGNLVLFFPISIGLLAFSWRELSRIERIGMLIAALSMASVVVLTKSRGAWLSLAAVSALMVMVRWRVGWYQLALIILAGFIASLGSSFPALQVFFQSDAIGGFEGRLEIASRAIYMIRDFPFTGIGMGSFEDIADLLYPFFLFPSGQIVHAHNLFLQIAVDLGLPGFITWMSIFLLVILCSLKMIRFGRLMNNRWYTGLGAGLLGSQIALTIHGLTDAVTWGMVRPAPLVWVIWGLAISLVNFQGQQENILYQSKEYKL